MSYRSDEDGGVEFVNGQLYTGTRRKTRISARNDYMDRQEALAERGEREMKERKDRGTVQIRVHRGIRADSMATLEEIPITVESVIEYLERRYEKKFIPESLTMKLYARGAPKVDWDYIYLIRHEMGVLAFTDMPVPGITQEK